jgi:hypothetical protein
VQERLPANRKFSEEFAYTFDEDYEDDEDDETDPIFTKQQISSFHQLQTINHFKQQPLFEKWHVSLKVDTKFKPSSESASANGIMEDTYRLSDLPKIVEESPTLTHSDFPPFVKQITDVSDGAAIND